MLKSKHHTEWQWPNGHEKPRDTSLSRYQSTLIMGKVTNSSFSGVSGWLIIYKLDKTSRSAKWHLKKVLFAIHTMFNVSIHTSINSWLFLSFNFLCILEYILSISFQSGNNGGKCVAALIFFTKLIYQVCRTCVLPPLCRVLYFK